MATNQQLFFSCALLVVRRLLQNLGCGEELLVGVLERLLPGVQGVLVVRHVLLVRLGGVDRSDTSAVLPPPFLVGQR